MDDDLYCVKRLGYEAGQEVVELVERVTGLPYPTKMGLVCPLAPLLRERAVSPTSVVVHVA